jgi:hypothetical protein
MRDSHQISYAQGGIGASPKFACKNIARASSIAPELAVERLRLQGTKCLVPLLTRSCGAKLAVMLHGKLQGLLGGVPIGAHRATAAVALHACMSGNQRCPKVYCVPT